MLSLDKFKAPSISRKREETRRRLSHTSEVQHIATYLEVVVSGKRDPGDKDGRNDRSSTCISECSTLIQG